jgi:hypothetical protein
MYCIQCISFLNLIAFIWFMFRPNICRSSTNGLQASALLRCILYALKIDTETAKLNLFFGDSSFDSLEKRVNSLNPRDARGKQ